MIGQLEPTQAHNLSALHYTRPQGGSDSSRATVEKRQADGTDPWCADLTKPQSNFFRSLKVLVADLGERFFVGLPYNFTSRRGNAKRENLEPSESPALEAQFEQLLASTVEAHVKAHELVKNEKFRTACVVTLQEFSERLMEGAVLAMPQLAMQRSQHKKVEAEVDEITKSDVIVSFDDNEIGWYSVSVPRAKFLDMPTVGTRVPLNILFDPDKGIVDFGLPARFYPKPPHRSEVVSQRALPPEPDDYDDPVKLKEYEERLRQHFRLPK